MHTTPHLIKRIGHRHALHFNERPQQVVQYGAAVAILIIDARADAEQVLQNVEIVLAVVRQPLGGEVVASTPLNALAVISGALEHG